MKNVLLGACLALSLAACATDPTASAPGEDKTYRTGSNIPVRDAAGVRTASPDAIEASKNQTLGNIRKPAGGS